MHPFLETSRKRALSTHSDDDDTRSKKARDTGSPSNNHSFDTSDMDVDPQPDHRFRETMTEVNRYEKSISTCSQTTLATESSQAIFCSRYSKKS